MFSMKHILIKFKFQLSRAMVNVKVAVLRNMLLAVRCFIYGLILIYLHTNFYVWSYVKFSLKMRRPEQWKKFSSNSNCDLDLIPIMLKHKLIKDVAIPMLSMNIFLIGSCFRGLWLMSRSQFFLMFKCYNTLNKYIRKWVSIQQWDQ